MTWFVGLGSTNSATRSSDGITWDAAGAIGTVPVTVRAMTHGNGVFVAVGDNTSGGGGCFTSPDGITWTSRSMPYAANWLDVTWNGSVFCAVGNSASGGAATSPDGITWTGRALTARTWKCIEWNGSVFAALADGTIAGAATSPDGITWTNRTVPSAQTFMRMAWNGSVFCATCSSVNNVVTSPDGITWTNRAIGAIANWTDIIWNGSVFCVITQTGTTCSTSPDGTTWTARTKQAGTGTPYWDSLAWNGSVFCAVAWNASEAQTSPDGITWTLRTTTAALYAVASGNAVNTVGSSSTAAVVGAGSVRQDTVTSGFSNAGVVSDTNTVTVWHAAALSSLASAYAAALVGVARSVTGYSIATAAGSGWASNSTLAAANSSATILAESIARVFNGFVTAQSMAAILTGSVTGVFASGYSAGIFTSLTQAPTIFWDVVYSTAQTSAASDGVRRTEATVIGTISIGGIILGQAKYIVAGMSEAQISSGIRFLQQYWDGWVFNLNTKAPSFYENFKFNSFARIGDNYYGCSDTGIYLLGGDLDDTMPINSTITTGTSDLTTDKYDGATTKTVPYVYVEASSPEPMLLTCNVEGQSYTYKTRVVKTAIASSRADVGKGLIGTFWQFEIKNQNGVDFNIESIIAAPISRSRRF